MRYALVLLAACSPPIPRPDQLPTSEWTLGLVAAHTDLRIFTLDDLPVTTWTLGLPVAGDGRLVVWLRGPDWASKVGFAHFRCDDCTLGDDHTRMKLEELDPFDFGRLALGDVRAERDFADGHVTITTTWRSPDFELDAHVRATLAPRAEDIVLDGCVLFRPTDALRAHDPKMHALVSLTGAPRDPQGDFTIKLAGTLGNMRKLGEVCALVR